MVANTTTAPCASNFTDPVAYARAEEEYFKQEVQAIDAWFRTQRFSGIQRPYTASEVARLRGNLKTGYMANAQSQKLWNMLVELKAKKEFTHTFGSLDPVQVAQMAKYLKTVYVSGWQCSSTASTTNEPGPDFADYPMDTVPNKVDQLFRAQLFQDRKQKEARARMSFQERANHLPTDFLRPIIADADTGHGGLTAVMKLTKLFLEAGAAGIHIEDQKVGVKKCGHMGGKVLVPTKEHVDRLSAARLAADIAGCETVVVARTDAVSATFIDSTIDPIDHPFILGATREVPSLNMFLEQAAIRGTDPNAATKDWMEQAQLLRFPEAVEKAIRNSSLSESEKNAKCQQWNARAFSLSLDAARQFAAELGFPNVFWSWDLPRSREGFYRIKGGVELAVARAIAFSKVADLIWMETATPNIEECRKFATGVHSVVPDQLLAYNLSPSFNWDASGMSDETIATFQQQIGRMGFTWQFITLAGFHTNALAIDNFAKDYGKRGVIAYVETIQRQERKLGVETLTHQKWSGAELADQQLQVATGGACSTSSMGEGVTESQFGGKGQSSL
eukprot:GFYU01001131.1.p1 GENE.GFYU01001131.1~~GFYU01001131.1.p1  ORF type:complete len:561 (-),score=209.25 GFYU01001131.1:1242-2924(-)